jgi:methylenetetrahydrofolate reductase (NADPH)
MTQIDSLDPVVASRAPEDDPSLRVSFEFFPPTDPEMELVLRASVARLSRLGPSFVSVTYGADGSTRDRTREVVDALRRDPLLAVAPHITSIGSSREQVLELARSYWASGVRHVVALRGDPPDSTPSRVPSVETYRWGVELVSALRATAPFEISVAAYPEVHPEATSAADDLDNLRRKVDAGATRAITQFFFDNDVFLRFRDACAAAGILAPIVPGILPINRFSQIQRFATRCGTRIPPAIARRFEGLDEDPETRRLLGAAVAIDQVEHLRRHGVTDFHFYTLNRADLTYATCHALGLRGRPAVTAT